MAKQTLIKLLYQMMKNSKRSDRDLAKVIGVSQPTITRTRQKLEKMGYIKEYTVVPDMTKLGLEIIAFTFLNLVKHPLKTEKNPSTTKNYENLEKWLETNPNIMFLAIGNGLNGKNRVMITAHKDFTEYSEFISDLRSGWATCLMDVDTFLISTKGKTLKPFSFKYIENIKGNQQITL
jgi:DNA-binding Lrp family transcriptional regulator